MEFSVLLSVYSKEKASHLRECFKSISRQTLKPNEIVLVEDGPLTDELYAEINTIQSKYSNLVLIKLDECRGLGNALREGMKHCSYPYIARMDTDDVCIPSRFRIQAAFLEQHPDIDICSSWMYEFKSNPENIITTKKLPESHQELEKYARKRNPLNHPTVMFRKEAVEKAGGYLDFPLFEDYYLWARMFVAGCKFHNIQKPLLLFRSSSAFKRRGGLKYAITECKLQHEFHRIGFISSAQMLKNILVRFPLRIIPTSLRKVIYILFLRSNR